MINAYKLKDTKSKDAFKYSYLSKKIYPYLKPVLPRAIMNLLIAIPLGLLDGVVALALRPYLDYVVNGNEQQTWTFLGHTVHIQSWFAAIIPFGIVLFAVVQGVLKYLSNYLTDWTANKMSLSLKKDLFHKKKKKIFDYCKAYIDSGGHYITVLIDENKIHYKNIYINIKDIC